MFSTSTTTCFFSNDPDLHGDVRHVVNLFGPNKVKLKKKRREEKSLNPVKKCEPYSLPKAKQTIFLIAACFNGSFPVFFSKAPRGALVTAATVVESRFLGDEVGRIRCANESLFERGGETLLLFGI